MKFLRQTVLLLFFAFTAQAQTLNWVFVSATGIPKPATDTGAKPLYLYLATAGDIYLDDVSVVAGSTTNGVNLVTNGGFEGSLSPWTIGSDGNNSASVASGNFAHSGTNSLHLVASAGGTTKNSSIWQDFSSLIATNGTYTLSFWYRQSTNGGPLIVRFSGGGITTTNNPAPAPAPDTTPPVIVGITPAGGATVSNLAQIQVTFSENVSGVDAEDLLIAGNPADSVSGSGSNYVFSFTQPSPGTVSIYWDIESAITDLSGNLFDTSGSWTYTLIDNIPPAIASTTPAAGAGRRQSHAGPGHIQRGGHRRERLRVFDQWRAGNGRERRRHWAVCVSIHATRARAGAILMVAGTKYPGRRVESFWRSRLDGDAGFGGNGSRVDQHGHQ